MADVIDDLVGGRYADPDGGPALDVCLQSVVIEDSLDGRESELLGALGLGDSVAVVSDPDTHAALGGRVERALGARFRVQPVPLSTRPHADESTADRLRRALAPGTDALVAVGAGTVNDLCKYVAAGLGRPYAVFATAPSMNGYTSTSASITRGSVKASLPARPPVGAFFDLEVIGSAPCRLVVAGLGESLCRSTAQVDWLMAHLLRGTPYRTAPFELLAAEEAALLANLDGLAAGSLAAIRSLVRTLVLSGFGMTVCGSSAPASQGEHLLAHYVGMKRLDLRDATFHGEQVGVCALAMTELQRRVLELPALPPLRPTSVTEAEVLALFGDGDCWREFRKKRLTPERASELNHRLEREWDSIRARLLAVGLGPAALAAALSRVGAPIRAGDLGWPPELFREAILNARLVRNRFTFLDLAAELGLLAELS